MKIFFTLSLSLFLSFSLFAQEKETIEFPEEELAAETVLPVFDKVAVVKNRNINFGKRIELSGGVGMGLTEALYNNKNINLSASYNFDNSHSISINYYSILNDLSTMGKDLRDGKGLLLGQTFDASLLPHPESYLLANYQMNAYYGKISLAKKSVLNLTLYGILGGGIVNLSDKHVIGVDAGLGLKVFLTNNIALKADLTILVYNGPDPTTAPTNNSISLSSSDLDESLLYQNFFNFGLVYLL